MGSEPRGCFFDVNAVSFADTAANVIDVLVMHNREEPGPQIGPRLPKVLFCYGAHQAVLDQIVCPHQIPGQSSCVAPQPRYLIFEQARECVHLLPSI